MPLPFHLLATHFFPPILAALSLGLLIHYLTSFGNNNMLIHWSLSVLSPELCLPSTMFFTITFHFFSMCFRFCYELIYSMWAFMFKVNSETRTMCAGAGVAAYWRLFRKRCYLSCPEMSRVDGSKNRILKDFFRKQAGTVQRRNRNILDL